MPKAYGVVGANYGDEGKGRCVDALVRLGDPLKTVVIRSNGGAQAGHTVVDPEGRRHVFHHFGSGSFAGAATHLSAFFVHHPIAFFQELEALEDFGLNPRVSADPRGYVTTPWDMMVNQAVESSRGHARHGSCGYGFGETVGRNEETPYGLSISDLYSPQLRGKLQDIRDIWLPMRLKQLNVVPDAATLNAIDDDRIFERFLDDCLTFAAIVSLKDDALVGDYETIVFEAAQGLLLDQNAADFPHVTRSNTGVENMAAIAREAGIDAIDVYYATRSYMTRHGAGPLKHERSLEGMFDVVDATNVPNPWQHSLRTALLDVDDLAQRIKNDLIKASEIVIRNHLMISCLDQITEKARFILDGRIEVCDIQDFVEILALRTSSVSVSGAWGPSSSEQRFDMWSANQISSAISVYSD